MFCQKHNTQMMELCFCIKLQAYKLYDNNSNDEGMITGYYEPLLYGSLKKNSKV